MKCTPAPAGRFVSTIGAKSASLCPAGTTSEIGATSCTKVVVPPTTIVAPTKTTTSTAAPTTTSPRLSTTTTVPEAKKPRPLALPNSLRVGRSQTITAPGPRNADGLAVTVQVSAPKICSVQSTSKGVVLKALKAGACRLRIKISGDATFEDSSYAATVQVK